VTYIIADCGGTHCGDPELAHRLVEMATMPIFHRGVRLKGIDAVKFTVRDLANEMSNKMASASYKIKHSFGDTYGEHRLHMELGKDTLLALKAQSFKRGAEFILTLCSPTLVKTYAPVADKLKVASRDLTNIPLIMALAKTDKHIILSTGMADDGESLEEAIKAIERERGIHGNLSVLHCISQYPAEYDVVNLWRIHDYRTSYGYPVGYSDHTTGVLAPSIAVAMGAKIIEKHITLDHEMRGTDHAGALDMDGIRRCIRDIRNTEKMIAMSSVADVKDATRLAREKLGRSLAWARSLKAGATIKPNHLTMVSPGNGLSWADRIKVIGMSLKGDVIRNDIIQLGELNG